MEDTDPDAPQPTELEEASAKFQASLEQCRHMVADYRSTIAAGGGKRARLVVANDADSKPQS